MRQTAQPFSKPWKGLIQHFELPTCYHFGPDEGSLTSSADTVRVGLLPPAKFLNAFGLEKQKNTTTYALDCSYALKRLKTNGTVHPDAAL